MSSQNEEEFLSNNTHLSNILPYSPVFIGKIIRTPALNSVLVKYHPQNDKMKKKIV